MGLQARARSLTHTLIHTLHAYLLQTQQVPHTQIFPHKSAVEVGMEKMKLTVLRLLTESQSERDCICSTHTNGGGRRATKSSTPSWLAVRRKRDGARALECIWFVWKCKACVRYCEQCRAHTSHEQRLTQMRGSEEITACWLFAPELLLVIFTALLLAFCIRTHIHRPARSNSAVLAVCAAE